MTLPVFDLPSAKNMSIEVAVATFVPTPLYWRVLHADSHDVLFGTRGSGKTMLLRMMSLPHLLAFARRDTRARKALYETRRLGLFLPLGLDWCVAYQDDNPRTFDLFVDGVNLVSADCLLDSIDHLLQSDVVRIANRAACERAVVEKLCAHWFRPDHPATYSIVELRASLLRHQAILRDIWRGRDSPPDPGQLTGAGFHFRSSTLLKPLGDAIQLANPLLSLPASHRWLVCLDELEDLKPQQTRAITTLLRSISPNLTLKITTQPYTLDSTDTAFAEYASAVDFRDFEIRRLQHDPADKEYRHLVACILRKRVKGAGRLAPERLAERLFGKTTFAERARLASPDFEQLREQLLAHTSNLDSARSKVPVLAIRHLRRAHEGHGRSSAYAGWDTIVRASDGNPGMFVRILNAFGLDPASAEEIPAARQHEVLLALANSWHEWSTALYSDGAALYRLVDRLGMILTQQIHDRRTSDGEISSEVNRFLVDLGDFDPHIAEAFRVGARHALFVAETLDGSVRYPAGRGVWRLSYALSPKYWLLLRRGRISKLGVRQLAFDFVPRRAADGIGTIEDFPPVDRIESSSAAEQEEI